MTLKNKTLKLRELLNQESLYNKFYQGVHDWSRVLQVAEQVLSPIKKITKAYNDKLEQFQKEVMSTPGKQQELDKVLVDMLNSEVEIKLAVIDEEEVKRSGLTPGELTEMLDIIKFDTKK